MGKMGYRMEAQGCLVRPNCHRSVFLAYRPAHFDLQQHPLPAQLRRHIGQRASQAPAHQPDSGNQGQGGS